jgi:hypothetical protein
LESARYARPVISTALGAEGSGLIPGVSYYQAESEKEWREIGDLLNLEECRTMGWSAFQEIRKRFDGRSIAEEFLQSLLRLNAALPSISRGRSSPVAEENVVKAR